MIHYVTISAKKSTLSLNLISFTLPESPKPVLRHIYFLGQKIFNSYLVFNLRFFILTWPVSFFSANTSSIVIYHCNCVLSSKIAKSAFLMIKTWPKQLLIGHAQQSKFSCQHFMRSCQYFFLKNWEKIYLEIKNTPKKDNLRIIAWEVWR